MIESYFMQSNDISKEDCIDIINWCFKRAVCFSGFNYTVAHYEPFKEAFELLQPHLILKRESTVYNGYEDCFLDFRREVQPTFYLYKCNQSTKAILENYYHLFLDLIGNVFFFKNDQSTLLTTSVESGFCIVCCKKKDINELRNPELWKENKLYYKYDIDEASEPSF